MLVRSGVGIFPPQRGDRVISDTSKPNVVYEVYGDFDPANRIESWFSQLAVCARTHFRHDLAMKEAKYWVDGTFEPGCSHPFEEVEDGYEQYIDGILTLRVKVRIASPELAAKVNTYFAKYWD